MSDSKTVNGGTGGTTPAMPVFYKRPRPLNATIDVGHTLKTLSDYGFARGTNAVVVNAVEVPFAMRTYPVVFSVGEPRAMVAVLGLVDGQNLFVGSDGAWAADTYIPAYVRRYPFILMEQPGSTELILCVDEGSGLIGSEGDRLLFENGQPSKLVQDALAFCREYHGQHLASLEFVQALAEQKLLVPNEARVTMNSGQQMTLRGFEVIDEAKFNALPDDVFLAWRKRGWLHLVYCHLMSMGNWQRLVDLEAKRAAAKG